MDRPAAVRSAAPARKCLRETSPAFVLFRSSSVIANAAPTNLYCDHIESVPLWLRIVLHLPMFCTRNQAWHQRQIRPRQHRFVSCPELVLEKKEDNHQGGLPRFGGSGLSGVTRKFHK